MKPTSRLVAVFTASVPLALVIGLAYPRLWTVWLAHVGAVVAAAGIDIVLALPRRRLTIDVGVPDQLYIGEPGVATVKLAGRGWRRDVRVHVLPELDEDFEPQPAFAIDLAVGDAGKRGREARGTAA